MPRVFTVLGQERRPSPEDIRKGLAQAGAAVPPRPEPRRQAAESPVQRSAGSLRRPERTTEQAANVRTSLAPPSRVRHGGGPRRPGLATSTFNVGGALARPQVGPGRAADLGPPCVRRGVAGGGGGGPRLIELFASTPACGRGRGPRRPRGRSEVTIPFRPRPSCSVNLQVDGQNFP